MTDKTTRSIICDNCSSELIVDSSYPARYSLELRAINTGINTSSIQYAVGVNPPIESTKHFCGMDCLSKWIGKHNLLS